MQKVLIISYFFPPCRLTGANRVGSWVKHLPESGIHPIVLTRNWNGEEDTEAARLADSGEKIRHVVEENAEYYYLPYRSTWRDKAFIRREQSFIFKYSSKLLTFLGLIFQNLSVKFIPFANIYELAREILSKDKEIKSVVISGNPFEQFFFGYLLKKEFNHIEWVADYRDDWTTNPLYNISFNSRLFKWYNQFFEKKWISNASKVLTVTELYRQRLADLHQRECYLLMNGYNEDLLKVKAMEKQEWFQITYSGTVYPHQDFDSIISIIERVSLEKPKMRFRLTFLGSKGFLNQRQRISLERATAENFRVEYTERLRWEEGISFVKGSDLLLIGSYGNLKGVIPSKIFEYISLGVPIICYPGDDDIIDEILAKSNTAIICHNENEAFVGIKSIIENNFEYNPRKSEIVKFSAKQQVSNLAKILKE